MRQRGLSDLWQRFGPQMTAGQPAGALQGSGSHACSGKQLGAFPVLARRRPALRSMPLPAGRPARRHAPAVPAACVPAAGFERPDPTPRRRGKEAGVVAGCRVSEGSIRASLRYRVLRGGEVVHTGPCASLKRHKLEVEAVGKGTECGVLLEGFDGVQPGDVLQCITGVCGAGALPVGLLAYAAAQRRGLWCGPAGGLAVGGRLLIVCGLSLPGPAHTCKREPRPKKSGPGRVHLPCSGDAGRRQGDKHCQGRQQVVKPLGAMTPGSHPGQARPLPCCLRAWQF